MPFRVITFQRHLFLGKEMQREAQESITRFTVLLVKTESISTASHILRTDHLCHRRGFQRSPGGAYCHLQLQQGPDCGKKGSPGAIAVVSDQQVLLAACPWETDVQELEFKDILFILFHGWGLSWPTWRVLHESFRCAVTLIWYMHHCCRVTPPFSTLIYLFLSLPYAGTSIFLAL